jgi:hypothetical protein|tara:strand:+ start:216 stop:923 length:708 start_codon:yes stop_codon:yes gene_type:complete
MVNIDTVYQKVLALANKEQRGYITPQEFNLFADKAQKEIVDQYFYDINQFGRLHGNDTEYADMLDLLSEKISVLEVRDMGVTVPATGILTYQNLRFPVYRLGSIMMPNGTKIQEVNNNEFYNLRSSPLMRPSLTSPSGPVFVNRFDGLNIDPPNVGTVDVSYIKLYKPQWGYVVVNEKALFDPDPAKTTNFDLHPVEESELVNRILMLAGITLEKPGLTQVAASLEAAKIQQEKQ